MFNKLKPYINTTLNSYSQIFFSENNLLALFLVAVSFLDPWVGLYGLIAVFTANFLANYLGFDKTAIKKGLYGFNPLLVGLGTGMMYQPSFSLTVIVLFAALLTLFISIALKGILTKYALPFLSIPFVIGMWTVLLATNDFSALGLSERGIYTYNELYALGGQNFVNVYEWLNNIEGFQSVKIYLLSLGAIFFQNNILAGLIIALGLLYFSRIAFSLSLLGFYSAYLFYLFIGADFSELEYTFIGFNYILTAIAIGGYFIIPSKSSYLWVLVLLPVTVLIASSLEHIFSVWQLPIYSLPFNITVLLFIYILKLRVSKNESLNDLFIKLANPEQTLYLHKIASEEFKSKNYFPISLPINGDWNIMQAHNGKYTHKDKWRHAWDFIIEDDKKKQFIGLGDFVEDYYCYNKPVFAPSYGYVVGINDGIEDNIIGEVNTAKNWGNSIVIKHTEFLYTLVSHLKSGTIKVKIGDYVKKGDLLANVGNSGHSAYPHLHFQVQATPYIGSETIDYPLYNYLVKSNNKTKLITFGKPEKDDIIANAITDEILKNILNFIPGKTLKASLENSTDTSDIWEIKKDIYNQTFIEDANTNSFIFFYTTEAGIFFTNFKGDKKSNLFILFKALYNVNKTFYDNIEIENNIRPDLFFNKATMWLQDFIAPFYIFLNVKYTLKYIEKDDEFLPTAIKISSKNKQYKFNKKIAEENYNITIFKKGNIKILFDDNSKNLIIKPHKDIIL